MPLDPNTSAALLAFVVAFVGIFKFLIQGTGETPEEKDSDQNNKVRVFSALTGAVSFAAWTATHTAFGHNDPALFSAIADALGEGFMAGAGGAAGVKAYHVALSAASKVTTKSAA